MDSYRVDHSYFTWYNLLDESPGPSQMIVTTFGLCVTLWNNTKCNILVVWCGPLPLAFLSNVTYACTNI